MKPEGPTDTRLPTRRTTLTLPAGSLRELKQIARARRVNLSTVVAEAVDEAAAQHRARQRTAEVLESYRRAFVGFSAEESMILDGIVLNFPSKGRLRRAL